MATKLICDRCGKEINSVSNMTIVATGKGISGFSDRTELCVSCAFWLKKFLNGDSMMLMREGGNATD